MISSSQREHLVYTLTGQIAILFFCIGWLFYYILPGRQAIAESVAFSSTKIAEYNTLKSEWLSIGELERIARPGGEYEELSKIISLSRGATETLIRKDNPDMEYIDWIKSKLISSDEDKKILIQAKAAINSIIPTMSSIGWSVEEDTITLKKFINFIEVKFIKQFNIASSVPISLQGVNFAKTKDIPEWIGYMDMRVDVLGSSKNIMSLIEYINKSGNPEFLTQTGLVDSGNPDVLDNPLFTISQFSLQDLPTNLGPNDENSGRITMRLYMRWGSAKDLKFFQDQLLIRIDKLIVVLDDEKQKCLSNASLCKSKEKVAELDETLRIIRKGMNDAIANRGWSAQIYTLSQFFTTVKNLENEMIGLLGEWVINNKN
jgi:hypothetical protein